MRNYPNTRETIPADCLVFERKLQAGSAENLTAPTDTAAHLIEQQYGRDGVLVERIVKPRMELFTPGEYHAKKMVHPALGAWSTEALCRRINDFLRESTDSGDQNPLDVYSSVHIGTADYDEPTPDGKVRVGFELLDDDLERFTKERQSAIDAVLDIAGVFPTDPIREWRNEDTDGLWIPVAKISANNPEEAGERAEELASTLEELRPSVLTADLFNAKVAHLIINLPIDQALGIEQI